MVANITSGPLIKVYSAQDLAAVVGAGRTTIFAAKRLGFKFTHGLKTTERSWWNWLEAHPDFRHRQAYPKPPPSKGPARKPAPCDKPDEQS